MIRRTFITTLAVLCAGASAASIQAAARPDVLPLRTAGTSLAVPADAVTIPGILSLQGRLTDSLGVPVPDTTYQVRFRLYVQASGGPHYWQETLSVPTDDGLFSTLLGAVTTVPYVPEPGSLYIGMKVGEDPEMIPRIRVASAAYSFLSDRARLADTARYAVSGGGGDNAWTRGTPDSVLFTVKQLGVARGGAANVIFGRGRQTHVNFGVACTTGTEGEDYAHCTVGGGYANTAGEIYSTVGGGSDNRAIDDFCTVGGGGGNTASGYYATVAGGSHNTASAGNSSVGGGLWNAATVTNATVAGGKFGVAAGYCAAVGGGVDNEATNEFATVGGGSGNHASGGNSTVAGGFGNTASGINAAVGGGFLNTAGGLASTVAGGEGCEVLAAHGFATGLGSAVGARHANSAAFNGQATTASGQLRCGVLSEAGGSFTIDHPLRPETEILNHYFVESPEMRNVYEGETVLDASGRAEVRLPDYFQALNRRPRIQLTGVGTFEVFIAGDISGNGFTVGGPAGARVYWQVTGERRDPSAEAIRQLMPVEQAKTGELAGRSLDRDFLAGIRGRTGN